jgi:hypothetical protein
MEIGRMLSTTTPKPPPGFLVILFAPILVAMAPVPDEQTRRDLLCYAVMSSLAEEGRENGDRERAKHADAAAKFFLGRVRSRAPDLEITKALAAEAAILGNRQVSEFVPGCIDERMRNLKSTIENNAKSRNNRDP